MSKVKLKQRQFVKSFLIISVIAILFAFLVMVLTETFLAITITLPAPPARSIRLREAPIEQDRVIVPSEKSMSCVDSLDKTPVRFRTDKNGFIMPSTIHPDPDLNIVFLGGSTTECLYCPEDARFPFLVGQELGKHFSKRINSYNAGV